MEEEKLQPEKEEQDIGLKELEQQLVQVQVHDQAEQLAVINKALASSQKQVEQLEVKLAGLEQVAFAQIVRGEANKTNRSLPRGA